MLYTVDSSVHPLSTMYLVCSADPDDHSDNPTVDIFDADKR